MEKIAKNNLVLRENGLPLMIKVRYWKDGLLWRSAPILLSLAAASLVYELALQISSWMIDAKIINEYNDIVYVNGLFAAMLIVPIFIGLMAHRLGEKRASLRKYIVAICFAAWTVAMWYLHETTLADWWLTLSITMMVILFTWLGFFSMIGWTIKTSLKQFGVIGKILGKILPVSIMVAIFGYFSTEFWQITDKILARNIFGFLAALGLIALITSFSVARAELNNDATLNKLLKNDKRPLRIVKKLNIFSVIMATQIIQGLIFFGLFTAVLMLLGSLVINDATITSWLGHAPKRVSFIKLAWPFSANEFYVAGFAASFATLNFLVSAATDKEFRQHLFDPILDNIRRCLKRTERNKS